MQRITLFNARKDFQSCSESNSNYLYNLLSFHPSTQIPSPLGTSPQCFNPQTFTGNLIIMYHIGYFFLKLCILYWGIAD